MARIVDVEGIGPVYAEKLQAAGIKTTDVLLEKGASLRPQGDRGQTGISHGLILEWVNHVDLYRIKGLALNILTCSKRQGSTRSSSWGTGLPRTCTRRCSKSTQRKSWSAACPLKAGRRLDRTGQKAAARVKLLSLTRCGLPEA